MPRYTVDRNGCGDYQIVDEETKREVCLVSFNYDDEVDNEKGMVDSEHIYDNVLARAQFVADALNAFTVHP